MQTDLKLRFGGCSVGGIKALNQDAFAAKLGAGRELEFKGGAAVIADGVSSCADSHIASQTSVTSFIEDYFSTPQSWSVKHSVSRVMHSLNRWLHQQNASSARQKDSMLCTFSAAVVKSNTLHCFHVGDSRIYHLHNGQLEQLTQDHTRIEAGRSYLARVLGGDSDLKVDYHSCPISAGDRLLLTSDGLHEFLTTSQLRQLMSDGSEDLEQAARQLVQKALDNGSDDNVTALMVAIDQLPQETLDESHQRLSRLPIPPALAPGNKIDGYEVLDVIFSGSRSHMYRVKDLETEQQFVLKAPSENFSEDPLYLDGFIREEWVGLRINHINVMKTFAPKRPKRFLYYLGEYIQGENLREWINDNPQPPLETVRALVKQMVQGLRAFQRADMVHQDLKPENIMIDRDGCIKILDFGTALIAGVEEIASPLDKSVPQGSVNYVAPEYLVGEAGNFRSDLFSLAVICYEMLTGALPYKEPSVKRVKLDHYNQLHYIPALQQRSDLPLWVEGCLQKALQANPAHRYEALSEFLQDLTQPNAALEARIKRQPLLERNPIRVWQGLCLVLLIINLLQLVRH